MAEVQPDPERVKHDFELSFDEAEAAGLDGSGCDGHPDFPHHWSTLTPKQRLMVQLMAGTDGIRPLEDLPTPEYTFAEIKAAALAVADRAKTEGIAEAECASN